MPRVHTTTKSRQGKTYDCVKCYKPITAGQTFYWWKKRVGGTYRQHTECGYPRPSQLSGRKTAVIEDALQDLNLGEVKVELPEGFEIQETGNAYDIEDAVEQITAALADVASEARSVGEEYEASADNMPDSLQQGYQAEAMRDVNQRLQDWAEQLEDPCSSGTTTVDLPDQADHSEKCPSCTGGEVPGPGGVGVRDCPACKGTGHTDVFDVEGWREAAQQAIDEAVAELVNEAEQLTGEMPEYEG